MVHEKFNEEKTKQLKSNTGNHLVAGGDTVELASLVEALLLKLIENLPH